MDLYLFEEMLRHSFSQFSSLRGSRRLSTLFDMRKSYEEGELHADEAGEDPLDFFERWMKEAIARPVIEPNAMTLSTAAIVRMDGEGKEGNNGEGERLVCRPSSRPVLVKSYDSRGLVWFTNYESRKAQELTQNPFASLQFHWVEMERVVRIEGKVEKISKEESDTYYKARPLDSRLGAWSSPQSKVIKNRAELIANFAKMTATHGLNPERPPFWGGYRLVPDQWQFWQGRTSRLHDRFRFILQDGKWTKDRLAP